MKKFLRTLILSGLLVVAPLVHAITVYHQPTPYPLFKADGTAMPQDINITHIHDGWMNNYYSSIMTLQRDDKLKLGGWGDTYRGYLNFDLVGLPKDPTNVALWLRFYPSGTVATPFQFCVPSSAWNTTVTWGTQPTLLGCTAVYYTTPTTDSWAGWYITSWYQNWQNGVWGKYGIMLNPQNNNNNFTFIRSSRYADFAVDATADGKRPILQFDFTPALDMKMPLRGNLSWLATTEVGGYDCKGLFDDAHSGSNYFSIDFSWRNKDQNGSQIYSESNNIPVIATTSGRVVKNSYTSTNGNYVVIHHNGGALESDPGFTTRYLHLKYPSTLPEQTIVAGGQLLGYMGSTGISTGTHLHFGVRYNNSGASSVPELTRVVMDGKILKSYQTECTVNASGIPMDWIRYYSSTNNPNP